MSVFENTIQVHTQKRNPRLRAPNPTPAKIGFRFSRKYSSFHAINTSLPINPFHASPLFVLGLSTILMKINLGVHYKFLQTRWPTVEGNLMTHLLNSIVVKSRPLSLSHIFSNIWSTLFPLYKNFLVLLRVIFSAYDGYLIVISNVISSCWLGWVVD